MCVQAITEEGRRDCDSDIISRALAQVDILHGPRVQHRGLTRHSRCRINSDFHMVATLSLLILVQCSHRRAKISVVLRTIIDGPILIGWWLHVALEALVIRARTRSPFQKGPSSPLPFSTSSNVETPSLTGGVNVEIRPTIRHDPIV